MSRFDYTREAETPKKKHGPTKRTNARKFQMLGQETTEHRAGRDRTRSTRAQLWVPLCHAGNAQAQKRPRISTRVSRNRDRRMTPLGPVRHAEQRQTRHPASAHEAPSSPSMQGTMSGSEERATGKKP